MNVMQSSTLSQPHLNEQTLRGLRCRTPFFAFSRRALSDNFHAYQKHLPAKTEICYAMKANSEEPVLRALHETGASFEVASKYELALLKKIRVPAHRIIHGSAVKPTDDICEFVKYGVDRFAFDSEQELLKIAKYAPHARVYVRALVDDRSGCMVNLSEKFGASLNDAIVLLLKAKELGMTPYGISFNVGSQATNARAWARGIKDVSGAMSRLLRRGVKIQVINLGGGFPHSYRPDQVLPTIEEISEHIGEAMKGLPYPVDFIVEPGRGLVANTFALVTSVIGKNRRSNSHWLYLDAGVYNALMESLTCQGNTKYRVASLNGHLSVAKGEFILTGPTGDSLDVIDRSVFLPAETDAGDRLAIYDTGAYTLSLATAFNGFLKPKIKALP